jgi:hypothetical protein
MDIMDLRDFGGRGGAAGDTKNMRDARLGAVEQASAMIA